MGDVRCTFEGRPFFDFGDAPGLVFPELDLRAGESVDGLDGRLRALEGPARTAVLVAIVMRLVRGSRYCIAGWKSLYLKLG